jgi:hypothetical protein
MAFLFPDSLLRLDLMVLLSDIVGATQQVKGISTLVRDATAAASRRSRA